MGDSFRDLTVWQRAIELTLAIYKLTTAFPDSERFGLTNQLRRLRFPLPAISLKGTAVRPKGSTSSSWVTLADRFPRLKPSL